MLLFLQHTAKRLLLTSSLFFPEVVIIPNDHLKTIKIERAGLLTNGVFFGRNMEFKKLIGPL